MWSARIRSDSLARTVAERAAEIMSRFRKKVGDAWKLAVDIINSDMAAS